MWCSWTSYYGDVTEDAIVKNADWLSEHLKPYGFRYVQIDDGYDRGPKEGHYWIEHWDKSKFPKGPEWIAGYIKSKGLHPGLWLVPNAYAGAVENHPDWYLRDRQGKIVLDYGTPALDSSHPEVLDFLKKLFGTLGSWGFDYYKFDGEHALPKYAPPVDLKRLHDPTADPLAVYRHRLEVIRQVIGPDTFVEGCPAGTPLNGIGFFNSYFNGQDVYNNWQGMYALFSSINANAFLNRVVVYVMPGEGMELGERISVEEARRRRPAEVVETARTREDPMIGFGVTTAEARTLVSLVALTGVVYPLAGVMPELPPERLPLLQRTMPTMPIAPMDLFSRGTDVDWDTFKHVRADDYIHHYPEILDLKVEAKAGTLRCGGAAQLAILPHHQDGLARPSARAPGRGTLRRLRFLEPETAGCGFRPNLGRGRRPRHAGAAGSSLLEAPAIAGHLPSYYRRVLHSGAFMGYSGQHPARALGNRARGRLHAFPLSAARHHVGRQGIGLGCGKHRPGPPGKGWESLVGQVQKPAVAGSLAGQVLNSAFHCRIPQGRGFLLMK